MRREHGHADAASPSLDRWFTSQLYPQELWPLHSLRPPQVTSIDLVVDSGGFFNPKTQTVLVRNIQINAQTFVTPPQNANPARACKAELASIGKTAFEHTYGSNHNLHNAFGKCVSAKARQHH
jgi:hypothetical protein